MTNYLSGGKPKSLSPLFHIIVILGGALVVIYLFTQPTTTTGRDGGVVGQTTTTRQDDKAKRNESARPISGWYTPMPRRWAPERHSHPNLKTEFKKKVNKIRTKYLALEGEKKAENELKLQKELLKVFKAYMKKEDELKAPSITYGKINDVDSATYGTREAAAETAWRGYQPNAEDKDKQDEKLLETMKTLLSLNGGSTKPPTPQKGYGAYTASSYKVETPKLKTKGFETSILMPSLARHEKMSKGLQGGAAKMQYGNLQKRLIAGSQMDREMVSDRPGIGSRIGKLLDPRHDQDIYLRARDKQLCDKKPCTDVLFGAGSDLYDTMQKCATTKK